MKILTTHEINHFSLHKQLQVMSYMMQCYVIEG